MKELKELPEKFESYEILPMMYEEDALVPFDDGGEDVECDLWVLQGRVGEDGIVIGEFYCLEYAKEIYARITGKEYEDE
jgi:hypothetical protein